MRAQFFNRTLSAIFSTILITFVLITVSSNQVNAQSTSEKNHITPQLYILLTEKDNLCGNGILNISAGEECDDGGESATCDSDCTHVICGDGIILYLKRDVSHYIKTITF